MQDFIYSNYSKYSVPIPSYSKNIKSTKDTLFLLSIDYLQIKGIPISID